MKKLLFICLWLISLSAFAQKVATPPTLTYRQSNTNELDMIVSSGGQLLTPSASLSITAEIRASDVGRIISTVSMSAVSSLDGTIRGILPDLQPNLYYLGLYVRRTGEPDYRVGVARIEILPIGSLRSITDASGLNVQINETKQVLDVKLDATPSAAIAAYYAQQARTTVSDSISAFAQVQDARDDSQDQQIGVRLTQQQGDLRYKPLGYTPSWTELTNKPTLFSGNYADLSNKPTIPTTASDLNTYTKTEVDNKITAVTPKFVTDRNAMLAITPIANTIVKIFVTSDSKYSNGPTEYTLMPNGTRYLTSFLITIDN